MREVQLSIPYELLCINLSTFPYKVYLMYYVYGRVFMIKHISFHQYTSNHDDFVLMQAFGNVDVVSWFCLTKSFMVKGIWSIIHK